jgi:hypothetical protein
MYNKRINDWNIHKNYKKSEKAAMVRAFKIERSSNKAVLQRDHVFAHDVTNTARTFKGRPVKMDRLIRYLRETRSLDDQLRPAFRGVPEPARLITEYGENRDAETLFRCAFQHLEFYIASKKPNNGWIAKGLPKDSDDFVDKCDAALQLRRQGRISAAFRKCNEALDSVRYLCLSQHPNLISLFFRMNLWKEDEANEEFVQSILNFVINMGKTVLGSSHPAVAACIVVQRLNIDSFTMSVWRTLNDLLCNGLSIRNPGISEVRIWYLQGLLYLRKDEEALEDLDQTLARKEIPESMSLWLQSAIFLFQTRYHEAGFNSKNLIVMTAVRDDNALTTRRSQRHAKNREAIMVGLVMWLGRQGRYVEAKERWLEILSFCRRVFGLFDRTTLENVLHPVDYLQEEARFKEAAALRRQYPHFFQ